MKINQDIWRKIKTKHLKDIYWFDEVQDSDENLEDKPVAAKSLKSSVLFWLILFFGLIIIGASVMLLVNELTNGQLAQYYYEQNVMVDTDFIDDKYLVKKVQPNFMQVQNDFYSWRWYQEALFYVNSVKSANLTDQPRLVVFTDLNRSTAKYKKNSEQKVAMASITKMMTAIIVREEYELSDKLALKKKINTYNCATN